MRIHVKAMDGIIWKVVDEHYVILNEANPTQVDNEIFVSNAQVMNVIICALCICEYHRVCKFEALFVCVFAFELLKKLANG
jgi:hypothetical protein